MVHAPHGRTQFAAPSLTWRPSSKLTMNLNVEYRDMNPLILNRIPAIGNRPADIPISTYLGSLLPKLAPLTDGWARRSSVR